MGRQEDPAASASPDPGGGPEQPLEAQLPPEIVATPAEVRVGREEITWWRPRWGDVAAEAGWRWILLTPALGLLAMGAVYVYRPVFRPVVYVLGAKLLIFVGAVAISLAGWVFRRIAKARREPFCIHCGYNLTGLPDNYRCPECGRPYSWRVIAEYRRDPQWFIERWHAQHDLPPPAAPFLAGPTRRRRRSRDGAS